MNKSENITNKSNMNDLKNKYRHELVADEKRTSEAIKTKDSFSYLALVDGVTSSYVLGYN